MCSATSTEFFHPMPSLFLSVAAKEPAEAFRDLMTRWKTPVFPCKPGKRAKVFQHVAETVRFPSTMARASCSSVQGFAPPLAGRERCPLPRGVWVQRAVIVVNALQSVTPVSHQEVWRHRNDAKFGPGTFFIHVKDGVQNTPLVPLLYLSQGASPCHLAGCRAPGLKDHAQGPL